MQSRQHASSHLLTFPSSYNQSRFLTTVLSFLLHIVFIILLPFASLRSLNARYQNLDCSHVRSTVSPLRLPINSLSASILHVAAVDIPWQRSQGAKITRILRIRDSGVKVSENQECLFLSTCSVQNFGPVFELSQS